MTDRAARLAEALSARYRVERELGAGGMATVYLAQDLKHGRPVALKVLRPELAAVVGAERFLKEIEVTAKLQHPNILPLYDSGEADGLLFYVMPFVEGESLRQRLERERELPLEEAVAITRSVAAALQYAHERGVIHRDIKPENILIQAGQALVADFGIALAVRHADGGRLTETGLSLGTPNYMSPEQATGDREIDARTDVFALGAVTYEMLTGEPPHTGASPQAVLAKILTEVPAPISHSRSLVPPNVEAAIRVALAKAPADRFASAEQFVNALNDPTFALPMLRAAPASKWRWLWPAATLVLAVALIWSLVEDTGPTTPTQVVRVSLSLPQEQAIRPSVKGLAIAPDGSAFVYPGPLETGSALWLRRLDEAEARPIPGTEGGSGPRFSPDGTRLSFAVYDGGWTINVVSLIDGTVTVVTDSAAADVASWTADGRLFFQGRNGLWSVRADGSELARATFADSVPIQRTHGRPFVLPGDRGVLHTTTGTGMLGVLDLRTGVSKPLGIRGSYLVYVASGHILFSGQAADEFYAVPFDVERLQVTGDPVRLPFTPRRGYFGALDLAVSDDGTLLYVSTERRRRETVWVSRDGSVRSVEPGWDGLMTAPRVNSTGTAFLGTLQTGEERIAAVKSLDGGPVRRIGFDLANPSAPVWHPREASVALVSDGVPFVVPLDGRPAAPMVEGFEASGAIWSPDGEWIVLMSSSWEGQPAQLHILASEGDSTPRVLIGSGESETAPSISPDGRFLAYVHGGNTDGEVVVRPFPDARNGRFQVSFGGGFSPVWSSDGRELFFRDLSARMMVAHIDTSESFRVVSVEPLFAASQYDFDWTWARYDAHPDGQRFAMVRQSGDELVLVVNWFEELSRLVGGGR